MPYLTHTSQKSKEKWLCLVDIGLSFKGGVCTLIALYKHVWCMSGNKRVATIWFPVGTLIGRAGEEFGLSDPNPMGSLREGRNFLLILIWYLPFIIFHKIQRCYQTQKVMPRDWYKFLLLTNLNELLIFSVWLSNPSYSVSF